MIKTVKNINYHKDLFMDLFLPEQEEFFVIVHFHGGGLVEGDKGDTHQYAEHLAKQGFAVATANYHLLPGARFPTFLDDAASAVKYIADNIEQYGKLKGIIISGQSAGAWITLMLCLNKEYLESKKLKNSAICGWISDSGQPTSHFHILEIEKGLDPLLQRIDETAPLFYVDKNTAFSHLLLMTYEQDLPNRLEQNKLLFSTIKSFNKSADVELKILKGYHCQGSSELDEDGEYQAIKIIKDWAKGL
jgi:dienelactone hydrolase